jgi:hypothetical protein
MSNQAEPISNSYLPRSVTLRAWRSHSPGNDRTSHRPGHPPNLDGVDHRKDIRDFLTSRRARITPQQAGLPVYGGTRRVAGLRREAVALMAGVSVDYYTRLERGNLSGVSEGVLDAVARAMHLHEAEREHLFALARAAKRCAPDPSTHRRGGGPAQRPAGAPQPALA